MPTLLTCDTLDQAESAIWHGVRDAFAEALGLEDDEVALHHIIIGDLGAESLDFLDIAFRLERTFDIRIPRGGIQDAARDGVQGDEYELEGVLTPVALQSLQAALPEIPPDEFRSNLRTSEVPELFRVATFYNLVVRLLEEDKGTRMAV